MNSNLIITVNNKNFCCFDSVDNFVINKNSALESVLIQSVAVICNIKDFKKVLRNQYSLSNTFSILDLVVFLFPKIVCAPTPRSIYNALSNNNVPQEEDSDIALKQDAVFIKEILHLCSEYIAKCSSEEQQELYSVAKFLQEDWGFANFVLKYLNKDINSTNSRYINVWESLKPIEEVKTLDSKAEEVIAISDIEVQQMLDDITEGFNNKRQGQQDYSLSIKHIFALQAEGNITTNVVLAEAATGVGKTFGYLAPALAFIKKNPLQRVLISTYSKALQKQIFSTLLQVPQDFPFKVCLIKGSNNYMCLLNYSKLLENLRLMPNSALFIGTIARWAKQTSDGDIEGGDLTPLAFEIFSDTMFAFLLNKREECTFKRCPHYKTCFIMKVKQKARNSNIVITNHTFSLLNNSLSIDYAIFDEAHHLFNTADEVFSSNLSIVSLYWLRLWLNGSNSLLNKAKSETNGFKARLSNILKEATDTTNQNEQELDIRIKSHVDILLACTYILPEDNAVTRIVGNIPKTVAEKFLYQVYLYVLQRNDDLNQFYTVESSLDNMADKEFIESVLLFKNELNKMLQAGLTLKELLKQKALFLEEIETSSLLEFINVFERICLNQLIEYISMLEEVISMYTKEETEENEEAPSVFVYRFMIEKEEGNVFNIGYYKNYLDPSLPLAASTLSSLKGCALTSATLINHTSNDNINEQDSLIARFGLGYLSEYNLYRINLKSPFNYKDNAKVIIVKSQSNPSVFTLSNMILEIFKSSKGGALALFTATSRLKQVYKQMQGTADNNIRVLAQHIDNKRLSGLIDIFKDDINSCLLGTDSARDGIDVPGESLRLVAFEKVPWPKPDILFKHRVKYFGKGYINEVTKLKLKQAFGRIIRKEDDKGIFIILGSAVPSELLTALPEDITVEKASLEEALVSIDKFFL